MHSFFQCNGGMLPMKFFTRKLRLIDEMFQTTGELCVRNPDLPRLFSAEWHCLSWNVPYRSRIRDFYVISLFFVICSTEYEKVSGMHSDPKNIAADNMKKPQSSSSVRNDGESRLEVSSPDATELDNHRSQNNYVNQQDVGVTGRQVSCIFLRVYIHSFLSSFLILGRARL